MVKYYFTYNTICIALSSTFITFMTISPHGVPYFLTQRVVAVYMASIIMFPISLSLSPWANFISLLYSSAPNKLYWGT